MGYCWVILFVQFMDSKMTTKGEWVAYTGSDEQIAEMWNATNGYTLKFSDKVDTEIRCAKTRFTEKEFITHCKLKRNVTHYCICNPHPLSDMICQWARTGQPVWVRWHIQADKWDEDIDGYDELYETTTPNWHIPNAEYSFTAFEE